MTEFQRNLTKFYALLAISSICLINSVNCDLCNLCNCSDNVKNNNFVIECKGGTKNGQTLDLGNFLWPPTDRNIEAYFNNLELTFVPKLVGDQKVILLNFDNNNIKQVAVEPFQFLKNIRSISFASNQLSSLSKDFLRMTYHLQELNLSNNSLSTIDDKLLGHLKNLTKIDLSYNKFTKLSTDLLTILKDIEILNFEGNAIFTIENDNLNNLAAKDLNLANNKMSILTSKLFDGFNEVETILLSKNSITNIDEDVFIKLHNLKSIDLSENKLEVLSLNVPESLKFFKVTNNQLKQWPLKQIPSEIEVIEVQKNKLIELFPSNEIVENLLVLNVSDNRIESLPNCDYFSLRKLDLSYNDLAEVPQNLKKFAPQLEVLILDHNPIENIDFIEKIRVRELSMSNMPILKSLSAFSLSNVEGTNTTDDDRNCVVIQISHCPLLTQIHEDSFKDVNLCKLDLSYNNLKEIPRNLIDWRNIDDGVNLQGNPFYCDCHSQWMLDVILNSLYEKQEHQFMLADLKCDGPEPFTNHRFVKYYKRPNAFCKPSSAMMMPPEDEVSSEFNTAGINFTFGKAPSVPLIIGVSAFVMIALMVAGFYMVREEQRRITRNQNRRLLK